MSENNLYTPLLVVGLYSLLILGAILLARYRKTGSILPEMDEFFLANRALSPLVMIGTCVGTVLSAFFAIGCPGLVYTHGIAGVGFIFLADVMGALVMVTYYKSLRSYAQEHKLYSPIECLTKAYSSKWVGMIAAVIMIVFLCPYIAIQLVGIGKFIEGLTDGAITYINGVGLMTIVVAVYLVFGGMRAVAYTDVIQAMAILIGIIGGAVFLVYSSWTSIPAFFERAQIQAPQYLTLPGPKNVHDFNMFASMSIFSVALFFMPQLLMRGMMAKNDRHLDIMAGGFLIALALAFIPCVIIGLSGVLLYGTDQESNQIVGIVFQNISNISVVGSIITGLLLIGVFGASMSTADSFLLSVGQIFVRDVVRPYKKLPSNIEILLCRITMTAILIGAFIIGLDPPKLMANLAVYSIAGATVLVPTYIAYQWPIRSPSAAILSMLLGLCVLAVLAITKTKPFGLHEGFAALVTSSIIYLMACCVLNFKKKKW